MHQVTVKKLDALLMVQTCKQRKQEVLFFWLSVRSPSLQCVTASPYMVFSKLCQVSALTEVHPRSVQMVPLSVVSPEVVYFPSLPQAYPPRILQMLAEQAQ